MIKIRRYTGRGSTVTEYPVLAEAEQVIRDAQQRKCLVFAESNDEQLQRGAPVVDDETYTVVPPIAGG